MAAKKTSKNAKQTQVETGAEFILVAPDGAVLMFEGGGCSELMADAYRFPTYAAAQERAEVAILSTLSHAEQGELKRLLLKMQAIPSERPRLTSRSA